MKPKIPPALALFLIAPIFGEMFSGSSPLNEYINPFTFITLGLLYGCGAIIVRELIVRWGKDWKSLLLLGIAYGIYEEGILVQSFFDPGWQDLGDLSVYGRAGGVNWVWTEHLIIFHAAVSIAASITFVQALYPGRRSQPWVRNRRWWIANWVGLLILTPIWSRLIQYDAGGWWFLSWIVIILLIWAARRIQPGPAPVVKEEPARPRWFWLLGFFGTLIEFIFVYSSGESQTVPFPLTLLMLALYTAVLIWLIRRMSGGFAAWDDRHRIALVNGTLMFFLVFVPLVAGAQYPITYITNPIFLILLWWAGRRIDKRLNTFSPTAQAQSVNL